MKRVWCDSGYLLRPDQTDLLDNGGMLYPQFFDGLAKFFWSRESDDARINLLAPVEVKEHLEASRYSFRFRVTYFCGMDKWSYDTDGWIECEGYKFWFKRLLPAPCEAPEEGSSDWCLGKKQDDPLGISQNENFSDENLAKVWPGEQVGPFTILGIPPQERSKWWKEVVWWVQDHEFITGMVALVAMVLALWLLIRLV